MLAGLLQIAVGIETPGEMIYRKESIDAQPCDFGGDNQKGTLSVRQSFKGANVLLTGVTGYVGSLVLEQLLRVCPEVGSVSVLIRAKKNMGAKERLENLLSSGMKNQMERT